MARVRANDLLGEALTTVAFDATVRPLGVAWAGSVRTSHGFDPGLHAARGAWR